MRTLQDAVTSFARDLARRIDLDPGLRVIALDSSLAEDGCSVLSYAALSDGDTAVATFTLRAGERFDRGARDCTEAAFTVAAVGAGAIKPERAA